MEVNTVGKPLSEAGWAYLAGFLDGDGAIMAMIERHAEKRYGFRVRILVKATQRYKRDVDWLTEHVGIGHIREHRTCYERRIRNQKHALWFLEQITPYLRSKKTQALLACRILRTPIRTRRNLLEVAQLADTLSSFNVRSKHRRKNFAAMIQGSDSRND